MPCTRSVARTLGPFMFGEDMNLNTTGLVVHSALFAALTIVIVKTQDQIVEFFT
jgi:hypothetical protein